jgi:hypothetical protein
MYTLQISRGNLTIRPTDGRTCELWLNDVRIRECISANEAASLVVRRQTGSADVDREDAPYPPDVEGWHWLSVCAANEDDQESTTGYLTTESVDEVATSPLDYREDSIAHLPHRNAFVRNS